MCSEKTPKQKVSEAQFVTGTAIRKHVSDDPKYRKCCSCPLPRLLQRHCEETEAGLEGVCHHTASEAYS